MRRDRCVLTALALCLAAVASVHHMYEKHSYALSTSLWPVDPPEHHEQHQQQLLLRDSVFDDVEGYGGIQRLGAPSNATQQIAEVKRAHEHALQALHNDIAQRDMQLERLTGELDALRIAHDKQSNQLARSDATLAPMELPIAQVELSTVGCDAAGRFVGEDIVGGDISDSVAINAQACCQRCARHQRGGGSCLGWTFAGGGGEQGNGGRCYLKSTVSPVLSPCNAHCFA